MPQSTTFRISLYKDDTTAPTAVTNLGAAKTNDGWKLTWNAASDTKSGIDYYEIRYGTNSKVASSIPIRSAENSILLDAENVNANDFAFQVRGTDHAGNTSEWSTLYTKGVVTKMPDLLITDVQVGTQSSYTEKQSITLSFTLKNSGDASASASKITIKDGTKVLATLDAAALTAGASREMTYTIPANTLAVGTHSLSVTADSSSAIAEKDETNNVSAACTLTITAVEPEPVKKSDLTVSQFRILNNSQAVSACQTTDSLVLSIEIQNTGTGAAKQTSVSILDNGKQLAVLSVSALNAGASAALTYAIAGGTLTSGSHTFTVVADSAAAEDESNENNNRRESSLTVSESAPDTPKKVKIYNDSTLTQQADSMSNITLSPSAGASSCKMVVSNGGMVSALTIGGNATVNVESGGVADGVTVRGTAAGFNNNPPPKFGTINVYGTAKNMTLASSSAYAVIKNGGTAENITHTAGTLTFESGSQFSGHLSVANSGKVTLNEGTKFVLSLEDCLEAPETPLILNWNKLNGGNLAAYTVTCNQNIADGTYCLASNASNFNSDITLKFTDSSYTCTIGLDKSLTYLNKHFNVSLDAENNLNLVIQTEGSDSLKISGSADGFSFNSDKLFSTYGFELSKDGFQSSLKLDVFSEHLDTYGIPEGTYQWRACVESENAWKNGTSFAVKAHTGSMLLQSNADNSPDLFFGRSTGVWNSCYLVQHVGDGTWSGTRETAILNGKNHIEDIFAGSDDANILVLTDDANGDALCLDDIYSSFPGEQRARLADLQEIHAGAGNDIIDMTSSRFAYEEAYTSINIRGGEGNDTIWANGSSYLFGDAGNDRLVGSSGNDVLAGGIGNDSMHGGGGDDIFTFCEEWGCDTVEQENGTITLWFASGDLSHWNSSARCYTFGENSVQVLGNAEVNLKFGNESGDYMYYEHEFRGAFLQESSTRIFGKSGSGVLASL